MEYRNPVIPGFYPDPSICRAGDTFYLVCSSFQFFPGVPLFESRDLINWTQIGHVLTRPSQLPLQNANSVGGIYAPTIRYYAGRFYMVTTNVTNGGHFYVWTDDIRGEWSEPIRVDQEGIDPSLFFEDGKAYFTSNGTRNGKSCILQCEIDIETGKRLTETRSIWGGTGGRFLESPHLYHIGQYYYLTASEGGTEYGHMVVCARSSSPYGPFEACAGNPVLTNRNCGGYILQGCGHSDLVDDTNGNWWMVHLGFRQIHPWMMFHITGREVSLVPVTFDADGWFSAGENGTARLRMHTDRIPDTVHQVQKLHHDFQNTVIGREWVFLQNPEAAHYRFGADSAALNAAAAPLGAEDASPAFIGIRQTEHDFTLNVSLRPAAQSAGVTVYMTGTTHYDLFLRPADGGFEAVCRAVLGTIVHETGTVRIPAGSEQVSLRIDGTALHDSFSVIVNGAEQTLGVLETRFLSTEVAGNFTGLMLGLFAEHAEQPDAWSEFTDFSLDFKLPDDAK